MWLFYLDDRRGKSGKKELDSFECDEICCAKLGHFVFPIKFSCFWLTAKSIHISKGGRMQYNKLLDIHIGVYESKSVRNKHTQTHNEMTASLTSGRQISCYTWCFLLSFGFVILIHRIVRANQHVCQVASERVIFALTPCHRK